MTVREGRVKLTSRFVAKLIDVMIALTLAKIVLSPLGPVIAILYSLFADGFRFGRLRGQSLGKALMGLRVIDRSSKEFCSLKQSVIRNSPVGFAIVFAVIPIYGWILLALIGPILAGVEGYLMVKVEAGHRLGDVMAETEVVNAYSG
jgi:uncharacterized RDD family membrane protein YckC